MVVRVGPFQRIVNVHWPDDSSGGGGSSDVYFIPLPEIVQDDSGLYGSPYGLTGDVPSEQYVYRASGPSFDSLGAPSAAAFCTASGGNATNDIGTIPYRFFEATDGPEPGYFYTQPTGVPRTYSGFSVSMMTYEYGPAVGPPDPSYIELGEASIDFISLRYTEESIGGRVFMPMGFFDLSFSGGDFSDGKYFVLVVAP